MPFRRTQHATTATAVVLVAVWAVLGAWLFCLFNERSGCGEIFASPVFDCFCVLWSSECRADSNLTPTSKMPFVVAVMCIPVRASTAKEAHIYVACIYSTAAVLLHDERLIIRPRKGYTKYCPRYVDGAPRKKTTRYPGYPGMKYRYVFMTLRQRTSFHRHTYM